MGHFFWCTMTQLDFFYTILHPSIEGMYLDKNYKVIYKRLVKTNRSYYGNLFSYYLHKAAIFRNIREAEIALKFISTHKEFNILHFSCKIDTIAYSPVASKQVIDIVLKDIKETKSIPYQYTVFGAQCNDFLTNNKSDLQGSDFFALFSRKVELLNKIIKHYESTGCSTLSDDILKIFDDPSDAHIT